MKFQTDLKIKEGETMKTLFGGVEPTVRPLAIFAVLAVLGLLQPAALLAKTQPSGIVDGKTDQGYPYMSGGIGIEERDFMRKDARDYNLDLSFADKQGHYLNDVNVVITDDHGKQLVDAITAGPWFYIELPAGKYDVKATYDNHIREIKNLEVSKGHSLTRLLHWQTADQKIAKAEQSQS
jgi:hypothetical protein